SIPTLARSMPPSPLDWKVHPPLLPTSPSCVCPFLARCSFFSCESDQNRLASTAAVCSFARLLPSFTGTLPLFLSLVCCSISDRLHHRSRVLPLSQAPPPRFGCLLLDACSPRLTSLSP